MIFHGFRNRPAAAARRFWHRQRRLCSWRGKTMLQRTGELLASVCHDVTIVAAAGKYADAAVARDRRPLGPAKGPPWWNPHGPSIVSAKTDSRDKNPRVGGAIRVLLP